MRRLPRIQELEFLLDQWLRMAVGGLWSGQDDYAVIYWDCAFSLALELDLDAVDPLSVDSAWNWVNLVQWVDEAKSVVK